MPGSAQAQSDTAGSTPLRRVPAPQPLKAAIRDEPLARVPTREKMVETTPGIIIAPQRSSSLVYSVLALLDVWARH
jgi:hypothetical protein